MEIADGIDDMDGVMKKCEGISVDLPASVEDTDISFFDNIITLPLPVSVIDKSNKPITLPCTLSAIDDQIILFTNK